MYFELNIFYCIKIYIKVLEMSLNNLYVIFFKMKIYVILYNMQNMYNYKNFLVRLYVILIVLLLEKMICLYDCRYLNIILFLYFF